VIFIVNCTGYSSGGVTNDLVRQKRNELFSQEKSRQLSLISRVEKIEVRHVGPPEDCVLLMNKGLSTPFNCAMRETWVLLMLIYSYPEIYCVRLILNCAAVVSNKIIQLLEYGPYGHYWKKRKGNAYFLLFFVWLLVFDLALYYTVYASVRFICSIHFTFPHFPHIQTHLSNLISKHVPFIGQSIYSLPCWYL